jgi:TrmH family RNA methyltransferase
MQTASNRTRIRIVQSRQNSRVKELRFGLAQACRTDQGRVSIEGVHLIQEALRSGLQVPVVFIREGDEALIDTLELLPPDSEILALTPDIFLSAVSTESPQGIAALVDPPDFSLESVFAAPSPLILVAAALQDPGNLGTLIRSAEAFGASGVLTLPGTVSPWNAKALRAASGSLFRLPVVAVREPELFTALRARGVRILATTASASSSMPNLTGPAAILIGNEGAGLSASLLAAADAVISIPCPGPVESLNAAVAASILLYEASRQRAHHNQQPQ